MDSCFIDDGYTREGLVAAEPGLHGELRFTYRPALSEERYQFVRQTDGDGRAYMRRLVQLIDRHLIDWQATDSHGNPRTKSVEQIVRLHPNILAKVLDQVLGYSAADAEADAKN